jgi:uncharacterized membrane protein
MTDYTYSKNKRNNMTKSLLAIILLVTSFLTASLLVGIISSIVGNATAAAGNTTAAAGNTTAAGGNHANNKTSASGNISSIPGTSQIEDRRHAPV